MGYCYKCENGGLRIYKGSLIVMKGKLTNILYSLIGKTIIGESINAISKNKEKTRLWHQRLGHVSQTGLEEL